MTRRKVAVIGAINLDVSACLQISSLNDIQLHDSNLGKINFSVGGVAANIARNLSLLDIEVLFITAFANDFQSQILKQNCKDFNLDIKESLFLDTERSSSYVCVNDKQNDMFVAVNDMDIYTKITPTFLSRKLDVINTCEVCVFDTNIPKDSIEFLAKNAKIPLFVDPVSTIKAKKLCSSLEYIHTITPNLLEAQSILGQQENGTDEKLAKDFLTKGIQNVYISLGKDGIFAYDKKHDIQLPSYRIGDGNTTGAGDSQMAAIVWAFLQKMDIKQSAKAAIAVASICMETTEAIHKDLNEGVLHERIQKC